MIDLTVIIVTWNYRADIDRCLTSIHSAGTVCPMKTVVVDNNSGDGTADTIARAFPWVELVRNAGNAGFAAANNQAVKRCDSRYVLLLNPDTQVSPGAFDGLVQFMDARPTAWAAGPSMVNSDGSLQRTGVRFPTLWNIFVESLFLDRMLPHSHVFGGHRELYRDPTITRKVDYVQGSCLIARREAITQVGGLDEEYFMYFEETDWCYRVSQAGGEVWYCPDVSVVHFGGGTTGHYDERRLVHYYASLILFYRKHHSLAGRAAVRLVIGCRAILRLLVWCAIAIARPGIRESARSSARGYLRVLAGVFR